MVYEKFVINKPAGHFDFPRFYKNLYIVNPKNTVGQIMLNDTETVDIQEIDLIENIQGGVKTISWKIDSSGLPVTLYLSNSFLKPKEITIKTLSAMPVDVVNTVLNVDIQNSLLDVNVTNSSFDVNILNSVLAVNVQNSVITVDQATDSVWDINVTNSVLAVDIQNSSLDVNITNSVLNVSVNGTASISIDDATITLDTLSFKEKNYKNSGITPISTSASDGSSTKTYTNTNTKNAYLFDCIASLEGSDPSSGKVVITLYDDSGTAQATVFHAYLNQTAYYETIFAEKHFDPPIVIPPNWYVTMYVQAGSGETVYGTMTIMEEV